MMKIKRYYKVDAGKRTRIYLGESVGEGGEARVYDIYYSPSYDPGKSRRDESLVAKIYAPPAKGSTPADTSEKLLFLIGLRKTVFKKPGGICFPQYLVEDEKGCCAGFLMPRYRGYSLDDVIGCFRDQRPMSQQKRPPLLREIAGRWTRVELAALAIRILRKLSRLHAKGFLMGDINPSNILLGEKGETFFIDVDSYQIEGFTCPVFRHEFISPRLAAMDNPADMFLIPEDEDYAIAVLVFHILFLGMHPYARSGRDFLEEEIRQRRFAYPLTFTRARHIPAGPSQNIWYSLPFEMRKAFHGVFSGSGGMYPDTAEWIRLLSDYKAGLEANAIRREIFPTADTALIQDDTFLGDTETETESDPITDPALRKFETVICPDGDDAGTDGGNTVFVEFGSSSIRCYNWHGDRWRAKPFKTGHFSLIDRKGRMDTGRLSANQDLKNLPASIASIRPEVSRIIAFGGSCLRLLANRSEVVETLREATGFDFGILTRDEETAMLADMALTMEPSIKDETMMIADVGGLLTDLIVRTPDGQVSRTTLPVLGSLTLLNWFLSTHPGDNRPTTAFSINDNAVAEEVRHSLPGLHPTVIVATGAVTHLIPRGEERAYLDGDMLKARMQELTKDLTSNRHEIQDFQMAVLAHNEKAVAKTNLRLALSVYSGIMQQAGISRLLALRFGLGKAFINHYQKSNPNIIHHA